MKKALIKPLAIILLFTTFIQPQCQNNKHPSKKSKSEEYKIQEEILKMGLKYNDYDAAKQALYKMIVLDTGNIALKDSLAVLYFKSGLYNQSILVSREILERDPNDTLILQAKAIAEKNIGLIIDAIDDYGKLYTLTKSVLHLYQLALLQYQLKRYVECNGSIDQLLANPQIDKQKINITTGKTQQTVPLKAAVWNMKGIVYMDMNEYDQAKIYFLEALKIFPEFELAKNNMKFLKKKIK